MSLTLTAPASWTVIANGSVRGADTTGDLVTTRFTETRPLSTYLIGFAAGPWSRFTSVVNGRPVSLYTRKSRAPEVDTDTLLALSHRALAWMEEYFDRPYPFEKFDLMLAPAFPFGGMEHPGLVMYNEDRFVFRDRPTLARRVGRFSTILHETAHQWFGDLVTMRWFDDLWLKEGFATYIGAKALADLEPASDAWKSFFQSNKPSAYAVDQTLGTTPLWQSLGNLDQAKSAYGAIVYNKAPSVLKQLNHLVGEDAFRRGVRAFLTTHAYGNATWQDLLGAIGAASGRSMRAFGEHFMLRPGMPSVEPRFTVANDRIVRLELTQRAIQPALSGSGAWPMRTRVLLAYPDGTSERIDVDLTGPVTTVASARGKPAPLFVFPNVDDFGYFVSLLDSTSVRSLERGAIRDVTDPCCEPCCGEHSGIRSVTRECQQPGSCALSWTSCRSSATNRSSPRLPDAWIGRFVSTCRLMTHRDFVPVPKPSSGQASATQIGRSVYAAACWMRSSGSRQVTMGAYD